MAAYPTFDNGIVAQLPMTTRLRYRNLTEDMPAGMRYSRYLWGSPLRSWRIDYSAFTDAELNTLETFWEAQQGAVKEFTFTDPNTSTAHTHCRFAQQSIDIRRVEKDVNAVTVLIDEYNA